MAIAARLLQCSSEAQLTPLAVIVRAVQAIVLTVSFHYWPDGEEFSMAILGRKHISPIIMDHAIA